MRSIMAREPDATASGSLETRGLLIYPFTSQGSVSKVTLSVGSCVPVWGSGSRVAG